MLYELTQNYPQAKYKAMFPWHINEDETHYPINTHTKICPNTVWSICKLGTDSFIKPKKGIIYEIKSKHKTSVLDTWTVLVECTSPAVHASTFKLLWVGMALWGKYFTLHCEGLQKICFSDTWSIIPNQIPIYKILFNITDNWLSTLYGYWKWIGKKKNFETN